MKKFEKWYKNYPPTTHYLSQYEYGRLVWRAALEWAKAMHDISSEPRFAMNIKEELGDQNEITDHQVKYED